MSNYTAEDSETIARLRHDLALAREERVNLQEENDRLERILQAPLSLKDLEVAWEAAEVPTADAPIREGDVVIAFNETNLWGYSVRRAHPIDFELGAKGYVRILSRAPRREPWADLADVLSGFAIHDHNGKEYPDVLAQRLYERGVRMAGGDDDE